MGVRPRGREELARLGWVVGAGTGGVIIGGGEVVYYGGNDNLPHIVPVRDGRIVMEKTVTFR